MVGSSRTQSQGNAISMKTNINATGTTTVATTTSTTANNATATTVLHK